MNWLRWRPDGEWLFSDPVIGSVIGMTLFVSLLLLVAYWLFNFA